VEVVGYLSFVDKQMTFEIGFCFGLIKGFLSIFYFRRLLFVPMQLR